MVRVFLSKIIVCGSYSLYIMNKYENKQIKYELEWICAFEVKLPSWNTLRISTQLNKPIIFNYTYSNNFPKSGPRSMCHITLVVQSITSNMWSITVVPSNKLIMAHQSENPNSGNHFGALHYSFSNPCSNSNPTPKHMLLTPINNMVHGMKFNLFIIKSRTLNHRKPQLLVIALTNKYLINKCTLERAFISI